MVWFSQQPGSIAYLYDIYLEPDFRNQGLGSQALQLVQERVQQKDCFAFSLHVFEENAAARRLYERMGMKPIGTQLYKRF